jgi:predicted outer membrane lipoprotein
MKFGNDATGNHSCIAGGDPMDRHNPDNRSGALLAQCKFSMIGALWLGQMPIENRPGPTVCGVDP